MLQLIAALPTIFSAVGKITGLFNKGKEAVRRCLAGIDAGGTANRSNNDVAGTAKPLGGNYGQAG